MRSGAFFLPLPFALLLGLSCTWRPEDSSKTKLSAQLPPVNGNSAAVGIGPTSDSTPAGARDGSLDRHLSELKTTIQTKLQSNEFSIVTLRPFVVVGDEPESVVQQRANDTVKWAVDRLKQDFFSKDPNEIIDIWLFKDETSYRKNARLMFGYAPTTPYGYYSSAHKALIMNIATGGGTLVHEIVHPFMEANFPASPPWLNEGLGSLYEQCGEVKGHIHGYTNWRLPGLQKAIREKRVPSFKTLMAMSSEDFYEDPGVNYAQARYLCYYLQQQGVLVSFYKEFHSEQKKDPTGFKSLQKVLGTTDMDSFQSSWEKYVLSLQQGYDVTVRQI
jgi:hypothetical protein